MSWSIKLLRLGGVDVKVHVTFVLILLWAAYRWGMASGQGLPGAVFGAVVTLLLFASVTLHELGHSAQAMRYGIKVRDITLWPFGGLTQMEGLPERPGQELRIALAGPVVNLAIGAVLAGLAQVLRLEGWMGVDRLYQALGDVSWEGLLAYLVTANFSLAIFNLIPAFPMDGGRALRAVLAMRTDYRRATRWAVGIGQALAWGLGLWGFASGSFTLVLVAVFVYLAAGAEGALAEAKGVLGAFRVGQAMSRQVQTLAPADPLGRAVDLTLQTMQADFPVVEDGRLVGFLAQQDLLEGLHRYGRERAVGDAMRTDFPSVAPDQPLFDAQQQLAGARLQSAPVAENGRVAGLLSLADINEAYGFLLALERPARAG